MKTKNNSINNRLASAAKERGKGRNKDPTLFFVIFPTQRKCTFDPLLIFGKISEKSNANYTPPPAVCAAFYVRSFDANRITAIDLSRYNNGDFLPGLRAAGEIAVKSYRFAGEYV